MTVTIYTMPDCVQCDNTMRYLDRKNISYEVVDLSVDAEAYEKVTALGYKSAPVVITDTDHWSGFRISKLHDLYLSRQ